MNSRELMDKALEASRFSHSPYSRFRVGAALLCADGTVVTGTNVENRSYGLTLCAERSAIVTAVGRGMKEFSALAISCPDADYPVSPCGACRQVISEFADPGMPIYFQGGKGELVETTAGELFPFDALKELGN